MQQPDPDEVCDFCSLPLDSAFIAWSFPKKTLRFHGDCAQAYASRLRNHAYHFKRNEQRLASQTNQETSERVLSVPESPKGKSPQTSTGRSPMGEGNSGFVALPA